MPLFAFTFGYSLTYFKLQNIDLVKNMLLRLFITAFISSIPYIHLQKDFVEFGVWPLNIMFMFTLAVLIMYINTLKRKYSNLIAGAIFILGGMFVEYYWAGLILVIFSYHFVKRPNWKNLLAIILSLILLVDLNGNLYAFLFLPIVYFSQFVDLKIKRIKHIFYVLYPLHLFLISGIKIFNS